MSKTDTFYGEPMAIVEWRAEDVKSLRPKWSLKRCEEELGNIDKHMSNRLTELGWEVMKDMLP